MLVHHHGYRRCRQGDLPGGRRSATNTAVAATMAEMYGTRYLGEVKAIFLPLGVFSSALSPMAMGMLIDAGYGMATLMGLNIGLALLAQAGATWMLTKPPVEQTL